jgi:hypothetical protein
MPEATFEATETVIAEVPAAVEERETVTGLKVAFRPPREPMAVRFTFPEKPFTPVRVIVELPEEPA